MGYPYSIVFHGGGTLGGTYLGLVQHFALECRFLVLQLLPFKSKYVTLSLNPDICLLPMCLDS